MIRIYCDRPGKPIIFACTHEARLSARYVFATFPSDGSSLPNSQRSECSRRLSSSRTPVPLQHISTLSTGENLQSDDTVLANKESNPNVLSSRCMLSQENDHDTQILRSDGKLSFINNENNAPKVNQPVLNPHQDHGRCDEIPSKKIKLSTPDFSGIDLMRDPLVDLEYADDIFPFGEDLDKIQSSDHIKEQCEHVWYGLLSFQI
ncbi:cell cycle checkpoint control protein rad9a [Schistosoma haematobium]|uniref:Cell cycle checkpoint control protein rad9a n=1 Tax=Schistosoma haematobium TaxID=6185 RepID=A0A922LIP1_SCHHA|nr:cell cycle checkpoint control protein rad9a [Schistosoma haematobium]KAH9585471.1 cell cycle checkpoint control protein rad9a [Schistosoma haematobium]